MRRSFLAIACAAALSVPAAAVAQDAAPPAPVPQDTSPSTGEAPADESYDARFERARTLATSGQREEAIALYSAMLQESPGNTDLLLARGRTYAWMDRYAEAEADLLAATQRSPQYADAWSGLGDMYLWSDRPQQAAEAYGQWAMLETEDPAPLVARGRAYRAAGDLEAARADFTAAGVRGADAGEVAGYLDSLQPRIQNQEAALPAGYRWSLRVGGSHTDFSPDRTNWNEYDVSLRRKFERGSLAVEMLRAHRFGQHDTAWALDAYASLWDRAYANVRYQNGPSADLYPDHAWRAELFQGVGDGWELSLSYDHLQFGESDTDMYGLGVGRYFGNFYARYRALHVPGVGSGSLSHRALLRYYYAGNADDYFEVNAGTGRSHERDGSDFDSIVADSDSSFGVNYVKFFDERWGVKAGASFANDVEGFDERTYSLALYARW